MKQRITSGIIYIIVVLSFYLLKVFVPTYGSLCFDVLIYGCSLIGTFEIVRAMNDNLAKTEKSIIFIFSAVCIPLCALGEFFYGYGIHVTAVLFFVLALALLSLLVFKNEESTPENIGAAFVSAVYPTLLLTLLVLANHIGEAPMFRDKLLASSADLDAMKFNSNLAILLILGISPIADCTAFFVGVSLKKVFPKKLAPTLSPNKTVVGFIGGLLGGVIGATLIYFIYNSFVGGFPHMGLWLPIYMIIGLLTALATAFGDLVESCIKRKKGLKDMGNLIPGHGGMLDRIDGTLFATVIVYAAFALIYLIA